MSTDHTSNIHNNNSVLSDSFLFENHLKLPSDFSSSPTLFPPLQPHGFQHDEPPALLDKDYLPVVNPDVSSQHASKSPLNTERTPLIRRLLDSFVKCSAPGGSDPGRPIFDIPMDSTRDINMAKVTCDTYSGYPHENAQKFLSQFESYTTFLNIHDDDRKVAAFHLHMKGPAVAWFNSLIDKSWESILNEFRTRFCNTQCGPTYPLETSIRSY